MENKRTVMKNSGGHLSYAGQPIWSQYLQPFLYLTCTQGGTISSALSHRRTTTPSGESPPILFKLANPKLLPLLCLAFSAETPIRLV